MNMSRTEWLEQSRKPSPHVRTRIVGVYYLLTVLTCVFIFYTHGTLAFMVDVIVTIIYLAITALFYSLSKLMK